MQIARNLAVRSSRAALCVSGFFLCSLLAAPPPASAQKPVVKAKQIQRQVATIDAKFKGKKPVRTFNLPEASGKGTSAAYWGTFDSVEKLSVVEKNLRGKLLQDFYWQQGLLIAARQRHFDYGGYIDDFTKETPVEVELVGDDRFEFDGESVLRQRSFGRPLPTERSEAQRMKAYANSYRRLTLTPETKAPNGGACRWICASNEMLECLAYKCQ
jgi:hypothetical protein